MEEQLLREKAKRYLVCYYAACRRKKHCLRWLAGPYVPSTDLVQTCVNVTNENVKNGNCPFYRSDKPVMMMRGFKHLFDEMPKRIGTAVRLELDEELGHSSYYKYRNGELPINAALSAHIAEVCRKHGWNEKPVFDAEGEEYEWD